MSISGMTPVTSVFWRENLCFMFGEDKMAAGYFVSSKGIFVHKYPLILHYNDWLVLEIITQWTGKTIL